MSGRLPASDIAAVIAGELAALAADAKTLAARLAPGDVVAAVVLPSNGLTDLLDIGGLRVAAELPPSLLPGETIMVHVEGFSGDRINLHVLAGRSPADAPSVTRVPSPAAQARPHPSAPAALRRTPVPAVSPAPAAAQPARPTGFGVPPRPPASAPAPVTPMKTVLEARLAAFHAMSPGARSSAIAPPAPGLVRPLIAMRAAAPATAPAAPVRRGPAGFAEPAALLRALHLPVTATNVTLARLALESPEKLPNALAVLERALTGSGDPRVATLSTLASFLARLEPRSPVLATQVAAYVDHVVTGREAKIGRLAAAEGAPVENAVAARAALDYDLKSLLFRLAAEPAAEPTPAATALNGAVAGALMAITAVQLDAANALAAQPEALAFPLPLALADGLGPARVRIDRDAPGPGRRRVDGDNFRLGLVLQTRNLGTLELGVSASGGALTLDVAAGDARTRAIVEPALATLTARLEKLNFSIAAARTAVIDATPIAASAASGKPVVESMRHVDVDA